MDETLAVALHRDHLGALAVQHLERGVAIVAEFSSARSLISKRADAILAQCFPD